MFNDYSDSNFLSLSHYGSTSHEGNWLRYHNIIKSSIFNPILLLKKTILEIFLIMAGIELVALNISGD